TNSWPALQQVWRSAGSHDWDGAGDNSALHTIPSHRRLYSILLLLSNLPPIRSRIRPITPTAHEHRSRQRSIPESRRSLRGQRQHQTDQCSVRSRSSGSYNGGSDIECGTSRSLRYQLASCNEGQYRDVAHLGTHRRRCTCTTTWNQPRDARHNSFRNHRCDHSGSPMGSTHRRHLRLLRRSELTTDSKSESFGDKRDQGSGHGKISEGE